MLMVRRGSWPNCSWARRWCARASECVLLNLHNIVVRTPRTSAIRRIEAALRMTGPGRQASRLFEFNFLTHL